MPFSRRDVLRATAGAGALAALNQLTQSAALAQSNSSFRAMVGVFLFGGSDNWNMIVPTDGRYAAYAASRGASLALPQSALSGLSGVPYGLHPALAPLQTAWSEGALNAVLNVGTLYQPITKAQYQASSTVSPINLFSHADQQNEWQGLLVRDANSTGFMGRQNDREATLATPDLISLGGSTLALLGNSSSPLILPSTGTIVQNGYNAVATDAVTTSRQAALTAIADGSSYGSTTQLTGAALTAAYSQAVLSNTILTSTTSTVDQYFKNTVTGAVLTSDVSHQLLRVARMIEARGTLGHSRQTFFVSQGGFDTHSNQVDATVLTGTQTSLFTDLAQALAGFYAAMKALGLQNNVTAFTMSDFGRTFKVNAQRGTDHAWGNNHLVLGGAVKDRTIQGSYPDVTLGGVQDVDSAALGRWIPTTAIEEYVGAVAQWYGVAAADMTYVFPNWATWSANGRGPLPLFG
jgi:uncharacterized protein (DUF1501 family)